MYENEELPFTSVYTTAKIGGSLILYTRTAGRSVLTETTAESGVKFPIFIIPLAFKADTL